MWMDLESVIPSEIRKRKILYTNTYVWNLEKWCRWAHLQEQRCRHRERTCEHGWGEGEWDELGEWDWQLSATTCEIAGGKPLHSTGASERRSEGLGCGGRKEIQEGGDKEYTSLIHCVVQQKLTQYGKVSKKGKRGHEKNKTYGPLIQYLHF